MDRRAQPNAFTPLERARFWLSDYGGAVAVAAGLCLLFAGLFAWMERSTEGPETFEQARVIRFGYRESKFVRNPIVIVRRKGGSVRQLIASRQSLRRCRRGDSITLVHRGDALFVHRQGCGTDENRDRAAP